MIWPKRPPLAFSVAETSVAEMSGPKRPRPKCPWPKCPTFHLRQCNKQKNHTLEWTLAWTITFNAQICIISCSLCVCVRACVCYCIAVDIIMSLNYSKGKWTLIFFSAPSLCSQLLSKCRLLITFENSSSPTKCSAENAYMCSLVSALAAREESVIHVIFFSAYLLLVTSADNLFKQLGHSSDPAKLSCENVCLWSLI